MERRTRDEEKKTSETNRLKPVNWEEYETDWRVMYPEEFYFKWYGRKPKSTDSWQPST